MGGQPLLGTTPPDVGEPVRGNVSDGPANPVIRRDAPMAHTLDERPPVHSATSLLPSISGWLVFGLSLLSGVVACQVGSDDPSVDGGNPVDGSSPAGDGSVSGDGGTVSCTPQETDLPDGFHPTRYDFMQGNLGCRGGICHNGSNGPLFSVAGSVYDSRAAGGNPVGGVHVYITDAGGREFHAVTASNGAFWFQDQVALPLRTFVSRCPDRIEMVANATGNCNGGGACHVEANKIFVNPLR